MLGVILGCIDCPDKLRELKHAAESVAKAQKQRAAGSIASEKSNPGFQPLKT
jgi:hypothetical protein